MGMREQFESSGEGAGYEVSKISKLSSNVESKVMVCLWHTVFVKKRIGLCALTNVPDKSFQCEI